MYHFLFVSMVIVDYYRPQRSWGKVIFLEACVKNSVRRGAFVAGGRAWQGACMAGGCAWQGACMAGRGMHAGGCDWQGERAGHTVNERAVRILLECILVYVNIHQM